jgi:hypothetical protein
VVVRVDWFMEFYRFEEWGHAGRTPLRGGR